MAKLERWPPSEWDEDDFYRDKLTRLPTRLHPFQIFRDRGGDTWTLLKGGDQEKPLATGIEGIFAAFRLMLEHYERWLPSAPISVVYFIGAELVRGGRVKIGVSRDPKARLRQLQTASGEPLQIFATVPGDARAEAAYHRKWRMRRVSGEWFILSDAILAEIDKLAPDPGRDRWPTKAGVSCNG